MLLKIILYGLAAYLALAALMFFSQRRLLYLPSSAKPDRAMVEAIGLRFWPSYDDYRGFIGAEPQPGQAKGTVIVFHGNAGAASDRSHFARALEPLGYRVILAEYPGYGGRPGKPKQTAFAADAKTTVELARREYGGPIYLMGESLGGGVAAAAVADPAVPVDAVVLVTPWDSLPNLAQTISWFLPAHLLVLDRYDNVKNLQSFRGPVAVVLAAQDEVIPARHGQALFDSLGQPKSLWSFADAGHNNWPIQPAEPWWREVMEFVAAGAQPAPSS